MYVCGAGDVSFAVVVVIVVHDTTAFITSACRATDRINIPVCIGEEAKPFWRRTPPAVRTGAGAVVDPFATVLSVSAQLFTYQKQYL